MAVLSVAEKPAPYSEDALASLWSRAHTLVDALVTRDGRRLRVVYPGRQSAAAGPDFRDAVLLTEDGKSLSGDVELHTEAPGWYSHAHHTDPNYNGVVLHVVFLPKGHESTSLQSGMSAPVAALDISGVAFHTALDASQPLPTLRIFDDDVGIDVDICEALDAAGDARFLAKSKGFAMDMQRSDADEVVYLALMDALGYASNRKPFRTLAQRVPYRSLAALRTEPPSVRLAALKAMLLGASGLMRRLERICPDEDAVELRRMRRHLRKVRAVRQSDWRLFRLRPANHPLRRIVGAAHILERCLDRGVAATLAGDLLDGGVRALSKRLEAPPYIGRGRARDMLVNVALPFLHAYASAGVRLPHRAHKDAGMDDMDALRQVARDCYAAHPALQENEITREMRRICGIDRKVRLKARQQQGLMHLYNTRVRRATELNGR